MAIVWKKTVERKMQDALFSSLFYTGTSRPYYQKVLGITAGLDHFRILNGQIWVSSDDATILTDLFLGKIREEGIGWCEETVERGLQKGEALVAFAESLNSKNFSGLPNQELLFLFREFCERNMEFGPFFYFTHLLVPVLEDRVKGIIAAKTRPERIREYFDVLTAPSNRNSEGEELLNLYRIAKVIQGERLDLDGEKIRELVSLHLSNFSWLGCWYFSGKPYAPEEIKARLTGLLKQDCVQRFRELERQIEENLQLTDNLLKELAFNEEEARLVKVVKRLVYFHTQRLETYFKAGYFTRTFLQAVANQFGITYSELLYFSFREIESMFTTGKVDRTELARRKQSWGMVFEDGKITALSGKQLEEYLQKEVVDEAPLRQKIKGRPAYGGNVRGEAVVVKELNDFQKMCEGKIIVAPMTQPAYVPIMQKAKAVVTDEGGILCHAAIISRELRIPCITGTKIATKLIKDGDLIEVDADKGIVRIL